MPGSSSRKGKPGRPVLHPRARKKWFAAVRLTTPEYDRLCQHAAQHRQDLSDVLREGLWLCYSVHASSSA